MTNGLSPGDTCLWKVSPGSSITLFSVCPAWATETITAAETACTNYTTRWDATIDLDTFLIQDQGTFLKAIRREELKSALLDSAHPLIVSGVCMLAALELVDLVPDCKVYLKRMASWGWADQDEIEGQMLETISEALGKPVSEFPLPLEVRAYHASHMPHRNADIIFLRYE